MFLSGFAILSISRNCNGFGLGRKSKSASYSPTQMKTRPNLLVTSSPYTGVECHTVNDFVNVLPQTPLPSSINLHHLYLKNVVDRRKTYERRRVPFMDTNQLPAARFYFTNWSEVVRCAVCVVEMFRWEKGDDALKEQHRWSPSCGFANGLCVGNIPILSNDKPEKSSQQPTRSREVCGPHFELRSNWRPERSKYYYLYFFFCYVCVFYKTAIIFNVLLQLQVLESLNTLYDNTILANGTTPSTLNSEDSLPNRPL